MYSKPVFWHPGLFLEPQHFQDTDWHNHQERMEILAVCLPFYEGVVKLKVDTAALAEKILSFENSELFFPDGSHVLWTGEIGNSNVFPIRRALPAWNDGKMMVYGCLDPFRERYNVAGLHEEPASEPEWPERYRAEVDRGETPDRYVQKCATLTGDETVMTRLSYNVRLLFGDELGERNRGMALPLLRLIKNGDTAVVDDEYIPPLTVVRGNRWLLERLGRFMGLLAAFPGRMDGVVDNDTLSLSELLTRQVAARLLAELDSYLQWIKASPWKVFQMIRAACAEMLAVSGADTEGGAMAIPRYEQYNLTFCFPALLEACEKLLTRFFPEIIAVVEPEYAQGILLFRLPESALASGAAFRLAVKSDEPLRTILSEGRLIAGTPDGVRDAIRLALPELPLAIAPTPRGLPHQDGCGYLAPGESHPVWKDVLAARCMALAYYPRRNSETGRLPSLARLYILRGGTV